MLDCVRAPVRLAAIAPDNGSLGFWGPRFPAGQELTYTTRGRAPEALGSKVDWHNIARRQADNTTASGSVSCWLWGPKRMQSIRGTDFLDSKGRLECNMLRCGN